MISNLAFAFVSLLFSSIIAVGGVQSNKIDQPLMANYELVGWNGDYNGNHIVINKSFNFTIENLRNETSGVYGLYQLDGDYNTGILQPISTTNKFDLVYAHSVMVQDNSTFALMMYIHPVQQNYRTAIEFYPIWKVDELNFTTETGVTDAYDTHLLVGVGTNTTAVRAYISNSFVQNYDNQMRTFADSSANRTNYTDNFVSYEFTNYGGVPLTYAFCPYFTEIESQNLNTDLDDMDTIIYFHTYVPYQSGDYYDGLETGRAIGYNNGYNEGLSVGYQNGYSEAMNSLGRNQTFMGLFNSIADTPLRFIYGLFNFNLFGTSVLVVVLSLLTATMVFAIIKKIWK